MMMEYIQKKLHEYEFEMVDKNCPRLHTSYPSARKPSHISSGPILHILKEADFLLACK
jgi:hypothetical protein